MSQPALEVTGSQDVGSSHSQLSVPLAPEALALAAAAPAAAVLEPPLPHAATRRDRDEGSGGRRDAVGGTRPERAGQTNTKRHQGCSVVGR